MFRKPEEIKTMPFMEGINPYNGTLFAEKFLNKPVLYENDNGDKIVVYHYIDSNTSEFFPVQVMLHPKSHLRGIYKLPSLKLYHFPKPKKEDYYELVLTTFEPISDVDKLAKFKKDTVLNNFIPEEIFFKFVEDSKNYLTHIKEIDTYVDFSIENGY